MSDSLRVLAALLGYPDARDARPPARDARRCSRAEGALAPSRRAELDALIDALQRADPLEAEADYVELFDRGRATSLHLFEHVHGDSRDRGPAMIDLGADLRRRPACSSPPGELPDYLPAVLEFASTQPPREARAFLGEIAHILNAHLRRAAASATAPMPSVLGALLELAGETAQPVEPAAEEPLDESWAEPPVFDGCSSKGQATARPAATRSASVRSERQTRSGRMSTLETYLHIFFFGFYPYICLAVFLMGSLARFDRDQYTWKSDSSQMLRAGTLRWGSNLFHVGILFLFFGHFVGLLTPHWVYEPFISAPHKQLLGDRTRAASPGLLCFVGLTPAAASPPLRSAHPADQPPHRHLRS